MQIDRQAENEMEAKMLRVTDLMTDEQSEYLNNFFLNQTVVINIFYYEENKDKMRTYLQ